MCFYLQLSSNKSLVKSSDWTSTCILSYKMNLNAEPVTIQRIATMKHQQLSFWIFTDLLFIYLFICCRTPSWMLLSVPMRHMKTHFLGTRYYLQGSVEFSFMLIIFNCSVRLRWFMNINLVQCICQSPLGISTHKTGNEQWGHAFMFHGVYLLLIN